MTDFKALLAAAKMPERAVPICLRGDLTAEFEELERQLDDAQRVVAASIEDAATAGGIAERMEELRREMLAHTYQFRLRAMPRPAWRAFIAEHPPRKDPETGEVDERDKYVGINSETFYPALIRASVVDPVLSDDGWRQLLGDDETERARRRAAGEPVEDGVLTDRQFDTLSSAAWGLNRRDIDVPFSLAASRMTWSSGTE